MKGDPWTPEELRGLSGVSAAEPSERLSRYFESVGGLLFRADLEIARGAVRRARSRAAESSLQPRRRQAGCRGAIP
jgi:hypothetical protein